MNLKYKAQLYPKNLPEKLGFNKIEEQLLENCKSELGRIEVKKMGFYSHQPSISILLNQVVEYLKLLDEQQDEYIDTGFETLKDIFGLLTIENTALSIDQFMKLRRFLRQWYLIVRLLRNGQDDYPDLYNLSNHYPYEKQILSDIETVFDHEGEIKLEVSPELNRIRSEIRKTEKVQDQKFEALLRHGKGKQWLSDEEQTIRNGRRVLSILSEHKRKIKGIIHDESATGKTTFLEPQSLVELGNDLFDLRQKERKEIYRILQQLTNEIRPYQEHLKAYQKMAAKFDFIQAKQQLAQSLEANFPIISKERKVQLLEAKHPLLSLQFKDSEREVVPLNLEIDKNNKFLIISGPNAGGKSICLKTVGLLQLMMQSGLLVPAAKNSKMSVFRQFFLSMGDDQSIENDLSTYSSHLKSLKHFANFSDANTLVLLDEFGTGTDPQFGGAIAEAVLDAIVEKGAFGVATTHYSNIKLYAEQKKGVMNASMLFNQKEMMPTYKLEMGRPGSSYAFEIAQRIGINKSILEYARQKIGDTAGSYEQLVIQLEKDKLSLETSLKEAQHKEKRYQKLQEEYKEMRNELKENKKRMALEYKTQLQNEIKNYNKKFEKTLAHLKSSGKSQDEIAKEIRKNLQKDSHRVEDEVTKLKDEVIYKKSEQQDLAEGDSVKLIGGNEVGIIQEIQRNAAVVAFNHLKTRVKLKELEKVADNKQKQKPKSTKGVSVNNYVMDFSSSIDVRGMRTVDALSVVENFLDQAYILNQSNLRIVHGKGDGILKKQIRAFLKASGMVTTFEYAHPDQGGDGVTEIKL